jgi:hypothetical protein
VVGLEPDLRAHLLLGHFAEHLELRTRVAAHEVHVVLLAVAPHPDLEDFGERIHHRHAHAVQSAGHLVGVLVELAAGVQHRHRELDARDLLDGMIVDGDAAPVVLDLDGIVGVNDHRYAIGKTGERFIDGVVDDFVDEVMQPSLGRRADVHAWAFPNRLETLQYRDLTCAVLVRRGLVGRFRHQLHSKMCRKKATE